MSRSRGRRSFVAAGIAALVAAGLLLSACTPLFGALFNLPAEIPAPAEDFASYEQQEPRWASCGNGIVCADVYAPLDWAHADPKRDAERITLRLAKHPAGNGHPIGTLFVNIGGPGASTVDAVLGWVDGLVSDRVLQRYDVVGWDPRGVGASSAVRCLDDAGLDDYLYGTGDPKVDGAALEFGSDAWIRAGIESSTEFGAACREKTGALLEHVDTGSTVRDLEMLRGIFGDEKLNYLGYSYGTRIGALYADEFPLRSGRLVLDGAMDPAASGGEIAQQQVIGIEGALRAYATDCLTRRGCPLGSSADTSVDQGMRRIGDLLARVRKRPIPAPDGRMLYDSTLFTAIVAPLYAQQRWTELDKLIEDVSEGSATVAFRLADEYNDRVGGVYRSNLTEAFTAINCLDYPRPQQPDGTERGFDVMRARAAETMRLAPVTGRYQSFDEVSCAGWPAPAVDVTGRVRAAGADPILVIGTTGDPATPFRWAQSLTEQLDSGVLLTYRGEGHTAYGQNACVDGIVDDYLLRGAVPGPGASCG